MARGRSRDGPIVVVGAGVFGLTLAYRLAAAGEETLLVERSDRLGGLAASFDCATGRHDVGPKRFHTEDPEVHAFLLEILGPDALGIGRESVVHFRGRYYRWPLGPNELLLLPKALAARAAWDLLSGRCRPKTIRTFEDYVLNLYGPTLCYSFFGDYSRKFLGIKPSETDADWASTGLKRAIIDRRLKLDNLRELLTAALTPDAQPEAGFLYPRGGTQTFVDLLAARARAAGAEVRSGAPVVGLEVSSSASRIEAVELPGERIRTDRVVWTGPIPAVCGLLGLEPPSLDYLSLHLYCLDVPGRPHPTFQWCYFGGRDLMMSRVSMPAQFDPGLARSDRTAILVEVTQPEIDCCGGDPEAVKPMIVADLRRVGLLGRGDRPGPVGHHRILDAYPIYRTGYRDEVARARSALSGVDGLVLGGRTGSFWYNNMDGSIEKALALADRLIES